jgi:threonine aldolase
LQNNIDRLKQDHTHASELAEVLCKKKFVKMVLPVETNIIIFELDETVPAPRFVSWLKEKDILGYAISPSRVRLVLHMDVTEEMVKKTIETIKSL